jgi:hypothetical protein
MDHFRQSDLRKTRSDPCIFCLSQCTSDIHIAAERATVRAGETSRIRRRHSIITGVAVLAMQAAFLIALCFIIH